MEFINYTLINDIIILSTDPVSEVVTATSPKNLGRPNGLDLNHLLMWTVKLPKAFRYCNRLLTQKNSSPSN